MSNKYKIVIVVLFVASIINILVFAYFLYDIRLIKDKVVTLENEIREDRQSHSVLNETSKSYIDDQVISSMTSLYEYIDLRFELSKTVVLDASSKGYTFIRTENGEFLVKLDDVKPYLNGYKIDFSIGNPSNIQYSDFIIILKYGQSLDSFRKTNNNISEWPKHMKIKETKFPDTIKPGYWNSFQISILPARADELEYMELSIDVDKVLLLSPH